MGLITIQQIESLYNETQQALKPIHDRLNNAIEEHSTDVHAAEKPLKTLMNMFYDQHLTDSMGVIVHIGSIIERDKNQFLVIDRGIREIFGFYMDDLSITVQSLTYRKDKTFKIYIRDLRHYTIMSATSNLNANPQKIELACL